MTFEEDFLWRVAITIFALSGFFVARHIRKHKKRGARPLACPAKFDCHSVVHSDYSRFFKVPVEVLGMAYYGVIFFVYLATIFAPGIFPNTSSNFFAGLSAGAFIFSLYLVGVQIFILKKGCLWCFVSAFITTIIFILTFIINDAYSVIL
ncbi:MAG: vitamin K epoxide reductase family protein [Minisyncoccia bacterium]